MLDLNVADLILVFLVLLVSLTVHEAAHAWTADRLGDPTARLLGRISLNPLVHIDPVGTVVLPLLAYTTGAPIIGWAKPVPVDGRHLRRPRQDFVLIAAAGPASNIALAVGAAAVLRAIPAGGVGGSGLALYDVCLLTLQLNLLLAVFNMVPVPPLDGGNVLAGLLPEPVGGLYDRFLRPYGFVLLYVLLLTGTLSTLIWPPFLFLSRLLRP